jgi:hypothetical protein
MSGLGHEEPFRRGSPLHRVSCHGLGDRLTRAANWLIFQGWPRVRRWLWLLHRVALVVALVLSLLALVVTVCPHGLGDRPRDVGGDPWTTRVWAADRMGGVTIRANTGRVLPDHGPPRRFGRLRLVVLVFLAVLALAGTGMLILTLRSHPINGALTVGAGAGRRAARLP